jgi:hypothetical protein
MSLGETRMRSLAVAVAAMGFAGWLTGPASAQPKGGRFGPNAAAYGWLSSLEEGKSQARRTGKPLMVVIRCVP